MSCITTSGTPLCCAATAKSSGLSIKNRNSISPCGGLTSNSPLTACVRGTGRVSPVVLLMAITAKRETMSSSIPAGISHRATN